MERLEFLRGSFYRAPSFCLEQGLSHIEGHVAMIYLFMLFSVFGFKPRMFYFRVPKFV